MAVGFDGVGTGTRAIYFGHMVRIIIDIKRHFSVITHLGESQLEGGWELIIIKFDCLERME